MTAQEFRDQSDWDGLAHTIQWGVNPEEIEDSTLRGLVKDARQALFAVESYLAATTEGE